MKIVCIADTHELHRELIVPEGDLLIHAGDWSMFSRSMAAIKDFGTWLRELPYAHKILIPGNHDSYLLDDRRQSRLTSGATILHGYGIEIVGLHIWGLGWIDSHSERIRQYARIPSGIDILITHIPAYGVLDGPPGLGIHSGDPYLHEALERVKPRIHVFGHVHTGAGMVTIGDTTYVNASMMREDGSLKDQPIVLRMRRE